MAPAAMSEHLHAATSSSATSGGTQPSLSSPLFPRSAASHVRGREQLSITAGQKKNAAKHTKMFPCCVFIFLTKANSLACAHKGSGSIREAKKVETGCVDTSPLSIR